MARYVIDPAVAIRLADDRVQVPEHHQLLAPTLWRSQVLARLFERGGAPDRSWKEVDPLLAHLRSLRIRLLGDRVLQRRAWEVATELAWPGTFDAEYIALTLLQGDALVTLDPHLAEGAAAYVTVEPIDVLVE